MKEHRSGAISFGRAMVFMDSWTDVHGAGVQWRSKSKANPSDFPNGFGPQGDAIRIYNYVRYGILISVKFVIIN